MIVLIIMILGTQFIKKGGGIIVAAPHAELGEIINTELIK